MSKLKVLFLCTGKSCRSQMAEGWARTLKADVIEAYSAGMEKRGLDPHTVRVMLEAGVDISNHASKTPAEIGPVDFDYVVTVCGHADQNCPALPRGAKVVHEGIEDPAQLTKNLVSEEEKLEVYRRVRDEIRQFVEGLPAVLEARSFTSERAAESECGAFHNFMHPPLGFCECV
jgi:arsenate reductase